MTKQIAVVVAGGISLLLSSAVASATSCAARITVLQTGGHLVSGMSDASGATYAVIQSSDGRVIQKFKLRLNPDASEGTVFGPNPRSRNASFAGIAGFSADENQLYRVSYVDKSFRVLCLTYMQLRSRPTIVVQPEIGLAKAAEDGADMSDADDDSAEIDAEADAALEAAVSANNGFSRAPTGQRSRTRK